MKLLIDVNKKTYPYSKNWQFGVGNDHAYTITRKDVCEYLKYVHSELGFKYLRFHGIFDDDMHIYQRLSDFPLFSKMPKANEVKEINFKQVAVVLDNILEAGFKPFVELSFMPSALASKKIVGFHYKNNITPPKSYRRWQEFIKLFIEFIIARYTLEEVKTWYFEVWNEPDIQIIFFRGSQEEYFKLYKMTAKAIKSVSPELKVGGPSTSGCLWIEDFVNFCQKEKAPYDFVSTHHYPGDGFGNNFGPERFKEIREKIQKMAREGGSVSEAMRDFFFHPKEYKNYPADILVEKDKHLREIVKDKPIFISEWNVLAVYAAPLQDEKMAASFIIKNCLDTKDICDGHMFWCLSDFFEEQFLIHKPFHGGFGLLNNEGIPKPNFYAFKILSKLYNERFDVSEDYIKCSCFKEGNKLQILLYNFDFDYNKKEEHNLTLVINGQAEKAQVSYINDTCTNPKHEWEKLGSPAVLTKEEINLIKTNGALKATPLPFYLQNGQTNLNVSLCTNDVAFIEVELGEIM